MTPELESLVERYTKFSTQSTTGGYLYLEVRCADILTICQALRSLDAEVVELRRDRERLNFVFQDNMKYEEPMLVNRDEVDAAIKGTN